MTNVNLKPSEWDFIRTRFPDQDEAADRRDRALLTLRRLGREKGLDAEHIHCALGLGIRDARLHRGYLFARPWYKARNVADQGIAAASLSGFGDLTIRFGVGPTLQVFNGSAGYEGWQLSGPGERTLVV